MNEPAPSFFARLSTAFELFFRALGDARFAARMAGAEAEQTPAAPSATPTLSFREPSPDAALQLLGLLQQQGRFIDFLEEDVTGFSDQEIGAAARVVHDGCRTALREHFKIVPVRNEPEGSRITLNDGFDASAVRLTGNVVGRPPYLGSLVHRGWRVDQAALPKVAEGHDLRVLAPAEVEL